MGVLCLLWAFEPSDHTLADVLFAVGCFEEAVLCLIDGAVFQQDAEIGAAVNHALQEITAQLVAEKDVVDLGKAKAQEQQFVFCAVELSVVKHNEQAVLLISGLADRSFQPVDVIDHQNVFLLADARFACHFRNGPSGDFLVVAQDEFHRITMMRLTMAFFPSALLATT